MERPAMKRLIALLLATTLATPPAAAARDTLTIGISQFPSGLHPYFDPEVVKSYILQFAIRPVTGFDASWTNHCRLCTGLPTLDNGGVTLETRPNGAPGMAIHLALRDDQFWADGVPVTTADLAATARIGGNPASGFPDTRTWGRVERVDIADAHHATLHLDEIWALYDRIPTLLPAHLEGKIADAAATPADYLKNTTYNRAQTTPGLYNGPYRITGYESGAQIVLERNQYWKGRAPPFQRIVIRGILNTAALQANLLSGDIDFAPEAIGLTIDQVLALQDRAPDRFAYAYHDTLTFNHLDVQLDNPILKDVRVRRAMLLGIDRRAIVDSIYKGRATVANGTMPPGDPMAAHDLPDIPYDPKAARALLEQAGWTLGSDGIRRDAAGQRLSVIFQTGSGIRLSELIEAVIQNQLKAIGIETTIANEPFRTLFGETMKKRLFRGLSFYSWTFGLSYPRRQLYHSSAIPTAANNYSGSNFMDWRNEAVDAAIATTENDLDEGHRRAAWAVLQHQYAEDLPSIPLYFPTQGLALPKWLHGYVPTGITDYPSLSVEDWTADGP
jgi:peptide/nickel transport system substrate-binding protein